MHKKLIYLSHWRFPSEKTMTPLILRTCAQFAALGYEVELWVPRRRNEYHDGEDVFALYHIAPKFTIRRLAVVDWMQWLGPLGFVLMVASFNWSAYRRLRHQDAVVYAHDMRDVIVPMRAGLPVFVEIHDFFESSFKALSRYVFTHAAGLIVTNTHKLEYLAKRYAVARERMLRQPNAVDAAAFDIPQSQAEARTQLQLPQDKKIVLYTGHLFSWKGVHTLADAAQFLPPDAAVYFVGGTTEDRHAMEAYVAAHNLPHIAFVAHQTPDKIPLYLRAADVLILPNTAKEEASRVETSPVKLFEYLAAGKPIVASDLPSVREIVSEREVLFAKPDDARSFAHVIVAALGPEGVNKAAAGKSLAATHSWEARGKAISELIERFS